MTPLCHEEHRWEKKWRFAQDRADTLRVYLDDMQLSWSLLYQQYGVRMPYLARDSFHERWLYRLVLFFLPRNHCLNQEAVYLGDPYFTSWCKRAVLPELTLAGVYFPLAGRICATLTFAEGTVRLRLHISRITWR